jgi:Protein of unknown function (DUF3761)
MSAPTRLPGHTMNTLIASLFIVGSVATTSVFAAAPAGAPAGSTGMCKDGTYSSAAEKKGACGGHKGVKEWYSEAAPATAATPAAAAAPAATTTTTKTAATTTAAAKTAPAPMGQPAAGGGPGKVWANTSTKVYHCPGDKYYGTTKQGEYMSEADAKSKGYHADHGKACG